MNPSEFDSLAQSEQNLWWFRGMKQMLFALLDPIARSQKILNVMEAGSGTGYMSQVMQRRYGWRMFPTELAWEGVSQTRLDERILPVQADIAACPHRDACFDAVISLDVLVHFPKGEEVRALREFARILRPGGLLFLRVSALNILHSRHSIFTQERQRFTRRRLTNAVEKQGFTVTRTTYANSILMPVALAKFRIWEPLTNSEPASGTAAPISEWLNNLLCWPLAVETACISRGLNFPSGQSLILIAHRN